MRKLFLLFVCTFLSLVVLAQNPRSNCSVKEETFNRRLPDGSVLTLRVSGTEMVQYFETLQGFTVLENKNGFFEYALLNEQGDLMGSGILAQNGLTPKNKNLTPHLRYSEAQIQGLSEAFYQYNQGNQKKAGGKPFPSKGNRKVLALLIQYPDLNASLPKSNFDSMMVKTNYNGTGSFKDYYLKSSFGQLNLQTDVFGWFMAPSGFLNYGKSNANYISNVGNLVKRAILAADSAGVDFSKYDNDSDGYADGIIIMHAGIGAEEQSAPGANNNVWSHRYNLSYTVGAVSVDGVLVDSYGIFPEKRYNGGAMSQVGIGVLTHEFGHLLDLPDLYSTQDNGEGAGNYANMAGGPWLNNEKTPCMHDAWSRIALGWLTPTVINATANYTLPKSLVDSNFAFKINTTQANEYFLLENRQKKGFDAYLPSKGLAVWHINTNKARLLSVASNNVNNDTSAYGVGLLQADGRRDLEKGNNRGDGGDLYPGTTNNRSIGKTTNPNSSLHFKIGGIKQPSNLIVNNITLNPDSSITFSIGNKPTASFNALPAKGCTPLNVNFENLSAFATSYLWKFSDGSSDTSKNPSKLYDTAGTYTATLYLLDSSGNTTDSSKQTILAEASPLADFSVSRGDSNTFTFTNKSVGALYVVWKFGTNQSSTQPNPVYTLSGNADVPYQLIAYSLNQCSDTAFGVMSFWPLGSKELSNAQQIIAYPNPFHENVSLSMELFKREELSITMRTALGNTVWKKEQLTLQAGKQQVDIQVKNLPAGVYLIEVQGADFNKILRVSTQ